MLTGILHSALMFFVFVDFYIWVEADQKVAYEFLNLSKLQLKNLSYYNTYSSQITSNFNCFITNSATATYITSKWPEELALQLYVSNSFLIWSDISHFFDLRQLTLLNMFIKKYCSETNLNHIFTMIDSNLSYLKHNLLMLLVSTHNLL